MKPSKRNRLTEAAKLAKYNGKAPALSKYAAKVRVITHAVHLVPQVAK